MKYALILIICLIASMTLKGQVQPFVLPTLNGKMKVLVVPLGEVETNDITVIQRAIEGYYWAQVTVSAPLVMPSTIKVNGLSKSIRMKDGQKQIVKDSNNLQIAELYGSLITRRGKEYDKVVGVTANSINSGEENWAIRGITFNMPTDTCSFVSTYLVKQQSLTKEEYEFRLAKVALHEFGHMLGLPHCGTTNNKPISTYSQKSSVEVGNPTCFMLESTPDGQQLYRTSNKLCMPCKDLIKNSIKD